MPQLQTRSNAMMSVKEQKPAEPKPEKPSITEKEEEMFDKQPKIKLDEDRRIIDEETQKVDMTITPTPEEIQNEEFVEEVVEKPKKKKKECSEKLKAHLARCREASLAKRRAKKAEKEKAKSQPTPQPTPQPQSNYCIDYDRIINGVSNSLYSRFGLDEPEMPPPTPVQRVQPQPVVNEQLKYQQSRLEQPTINKQMLLEYEKKIRQDERERMKKERQAELDKTYKSKGMHILKNGIPTGNPRSHMQTPAPNPNNPFANAFGRRF